MTGIKRTLCALAAAGGLLLFAADVSPWDAWRLGYTNFELGEQHRDRGEYTQALEAFQKALENYQAVKKARPDWNQRVISERIADCERETANLKRLLGNTTPPPDSSEPAVTELPGEADVLRKQLAEAEAEIEKLRSNDSKTRNLEAEITHLMRDQRIAADKYALLEQRYRQLEEQSKRPDSRIAELQSQLLELRTAAEITANRLKLAEEKSARLEEQGFKSTNSLRAAENALKMRDETISELNRQLEELRRSATEAAATPAPPPATGTAPADNGEIQQLRAEMAEKERELAENRKEILSLRQRASLAESNAGFNAIETAKLRDNTRRLEDELRAALEKATQLDQRLKNRTDIDLRRSTEAAEEQQRLSEELNRATTELTQLRAEAETRKLRQEQLEDEATRNAATIQQLRDERTALRKEIQEAAAFRDQLGKLPEQYAELQKNFAALQAENKQNRLLAEAAKPREAELASIKLRLVELDQLKASLSREQRLVEELQASRRVLEAEVASLRPAADELATARRQLEELPALRQELERQRNIAVELAAAKSLEGELAQAKLQLVETDKLRAELEALRRKSADSDNARTKELQARIASLESEVTGLRKLGEELAAAKNLEGELAQAKLQVAEFAQVKEELARLTRRNSELEAERAELEKQLKERPLLQIEGSLPIAVFTAPPEESPDDLFAAGVHALDEESYELAAWNFRQALKGNPNHTDAAKRLGLLLYSQERFEEALPLLRQARAADPGNPDLGVAAARSSIATGNFGGALAILEPLIKGNPDHPGLQLALALAEAGSGEPERAENRLRFVARLSPDDPAPQLELAKLLLTVDASRIQEATRCYEKARLLGTPPDLDLEPRLGKMLDDRRETSAFLAEAAREAGSNDDWEAAAWYYRRLLELDREPQRFAPRLAFAQYKGGNPAAALETLAFRRPATPEGALVTMLIRYQRQEIPEALEAAREAKSANNGARVEIPVDWSELRLELDRVLADRSNATVRILRDSYSNE